MNIEQVIYGYVVNEEQYPDKAAIIEEGSKGDWAYLLLEGQVKVKKLTGKGLVTVDTLKKGAIFGEMGLLAKGESIRTASVFADGPVRLGVLDTQRIVKDFESISPQLRTLLSSLIMRLKVSTDRLSAMVIQAMG